MKTSRSRGFTIVEALVIVVIVGVITAVGLTFYNSVTKNAKTDTTSSDQAILDSPTPEVTSTKDLTTVSDELDKLDIDDTSDTAQLDEQASF